LTSSGVQRGMKTLSVGARTLYVKQLFFTLMILAWGSAASALVTLAGLLVLEQYPAHRGQVWLFTVSAMFSAIGVYVLVCSLYMGLAYMLRGMAPRKALTRLAQSKVTKTVCLAIIGSMVLAVLSAVLGNGILAGLGYLVSLATILVSVIVILAAGYMVTGSLRIETVWLIALFIGGAAGLTIARRLLPGYSILSVVRGEAEPSLTTLAASMLDSFIFLGASVALLHALCVSLEPLAGCILVDREESNTSLSD